MVRRIGFSGDGSHIWLSAEAGGDKLRLMPLMGGQPRPFVGDIVNVAWSSDGTRIVYHTADPGDPMFIADQDGRQSPPDSCGRTWSAPALSGMVSGRPVDLFC